MWQQRQPQRRLPPPRIIVIARRCPLPPKIPNTTRSTCRRTLATRMRPAARLHPSRCRQPAVAAAATRTKTPSTTSTRTRRRRRPSTAALMTWQEGWAAAGHQPAASNMPARMSPAPSSSSASSASSSSPSSSSLSSCSRCGRQRRPASR